MSEVLVLNTGSSSLKCQLIMPDTGEVFASALVERIGSAQSAVHIKVTGGSPHSQDLPIVDHGHALSTVIEMLETQGLVLHERDLVAVGHRVVQGGDLFAEPTLLTDEIVEQIAELSTLAPLHNPGHVAGIKAAREILSDLPHIAVFDTAFHQSMPPEAYTYAFNSEIAADLKIRRYGFHGTSHKYVYEKTCAHLGLDPASARVIVLHLGNGASVTAVRGGQSVATSMGLTPLQGLVMGTRTGDIDPAVLLHLKRQGRYTVDEIDELLNKKSGLLGMTGSNDMRDVLTMRERGETDAQLALDVYCRRILEYIGSYFAVLGGLDAIAFTAGVGEHSPYVREHALKNLEHMGIVVDRSANESVERAALAEISAVDSKVKVLVVPTNEELEIARQCAQMLNSRG